MCDRARSWLSTVSDASTNMIEVLLALLGSVAVLVAAKTAPKETNRRKRRLFFGGYALAFVIIWVQYFQQLHEAKEDDAKHKQLVAQSEKDAKQLSELLTQNVALGAKLDPILAAAQAQHPGLNESQALAKAVEELEKLNPQLAQLNSDRHRALSKEDITLRREAYTQAILSVHYWKNVYMGLNPELNRSGGSSKYKDIWDKLLAEAIPTFSRENWVRYRPMFEGELNTLSGRLQDVLSAFVDVVPPAARTLISQTRTQLESSRSLYHWAGRGAGDDAMFRTIFVSTLRDLRAVDAEFQRLRDALPRESKQP
jgi:hypothetical protein